MSQPLLSIGMIVKNEERCLEKCLKALEPLRRAIPCELVIADTGSTDRTKEIASKYADILFDFTWINDFSAARNAVMDKCSGKWYLTVDADEYLSSPIDEIVTFLTGPLSQKHIHATIIQRNFLSPDMSGNFADFNALRMVRMDTGKRYEGSIHESFEKIEIPLTTIFQNTIFDHDGYALLTPKHLKEKSKRNMELLEKELEKEPESIRRVLQCLESIEGNIEKKRYYADYARRILTSKKNIDFDYELCSGPCAREIFQVMLSDRHPETPKFIKWTFKNMSDSYHVSLDIRYIYIKFLYMEENYDECIKVCNDYLNALNSYQKRGRTTKATDFATPILYCQKKHKQEIETLLANSLINTTKYSDANQVLKNIDLSETTENTTINWFSAILNTESIEPFYETAKNTIGKLLEKYHKQELKSNDPYDFVISTISKPFSCNQKREQDYNVFKLVPGTIGLSVNIANAKTKEEIEELLNKIEIWEELMPLALGRTIELGALIPKEFYFMNSTRLTYLTQDLIKGIKTYINPLLSYYCDTNETTKFYKVTFAFNLLSTLLVSEQFTTLNEEEKNKTIIAYINVSKNYLTRCYNKELLKNEELMSCVPVIHLFAWYLIKATDIKNVDTLEYIKTLKTLLKKIPQAKQATDFLIKKFQNDEEQKRQEKIKNASPELVAMAEQLKTMLAAFPENSPELQAIKQSPMFKQVAFLIEN